MKNRIFYGWFVVTACFAITCTLGEAMWSFGVFFRPLEVEFDWSRQLVSSAYTVFLLGFAISLMVSGWLADRYHPRPILFGSAFLAGLGFALCSQVTDIWQLRAFLLIAGLGAGATWAIPSSLVQRWFQGRRHSGLALAIVTIGVGVGALIFAPLINHLIEIYSWRNAFLIVGPVFALIIVVAGLVVKPSPSSQESRAPSGSGEKQPPPVGWAAGQAVRMAAFIGITISLCFAIMAWQTIAVHLVPYALDQGIPAATAALALGTIGGVSIAGRLCSGLVSERIGWQKTLVASYAGMGLSIVLLIMVRSPLMLFVFVIVYGFFHGGRIPAQAAILNTYFGLRSLGALIGMTAAVAQILAAFAPFIVGFIFDVTGGYLVAFAAIGVAFLLGALILATVKRPVNHGST